MAEYTKPLPNPTHEDKEFWFAAKRHELLLKKCHDCGAYVWFTDPMCTECQSMEMDWVPSEGKGTIFTFNIVYRNFTRGYTDEDLPYINVIVELDEGARMFANLVDCKPEDVKIDMPVELFFEDVTEEFALPRFRPAKA